MEIFACAAWNLWKQHNDLISEGKPIELGDGK
jgi:hypothetical protein